MTIPDLVLADGDRAFGWLERAYEERPMLYFGIAPVLDGIRGDPRYAKLLASQRRQHAKRTE